MLGKHNAFILTLGLIFVVLAIAPISRENTVLTKFIAEIYVLGYNLRLIITILTFVLEFTVAFLASEKIKIKLDYHHSQPSKRHDLKLIKLSCVWGQLLFLCIHTVVSVMLPCLQISAITFVSKVISDKK